MIELKVPARICFYGDHQDYLGLPVIAGSIDRYINVKAVANQDKKYRLKLLDLNEEVIISVDDDLKDIQPGDYYRSVMSILKIKDFPLNKDTIWKYRGIFP